MLRDMAYLVSAGGCGCSQGQDDSMAGVVGVKAIHSGCRVVQPARIQNAELSPTGPPMEAMQEDVQQSELFLDSTNHPAAHVLVLMSSNEQGHLVKIAGPMDSYHALK